MLSKIADVIERIMMERAESMEALPSAFILNRNTYCEIYKELMQVRVYVQPDQTAVFHPPGAFVYNTPYGYAKIYQGPEFLPEHTVIPVYENETINDAIERHYMWGKMDEIIMEIIEEEHEDTMHR